MTDYVTSLKFEEGTELKVYPCSKGYSTIGTGRNLDAKGISQDEADYMLNNDIVDAKHAAAELVPSFYQLTDERRIALVNMTFQIGKRGVSNFKKMIKAIKVEDYDKAAIEMLDSKWAKQTPARAQRMADRMRNG